MTLTPSKSAVRRDLDELLRVHTRKNWVVYLVWSPVVIAGGIIPDGLFMAVGLVVGLSVYAWEKRFKRKSVEAFSARFPAGRPERAIAMQLLEGKIKDNYDTAELFRALGGVESLPKADDKPADGKIQDALAQLGPLPAVPVPSPASRHAAPGLDHIPLEPDDLRPLEGAKGRPPC